jgi:dolichol-phosphate mannosyltransferase
MILQKGWQIPEFILLDFSKKSSQYAICVFTINEGEKLQNQITGMKPLAGDYDIIIADGGSVDGSTRHDFLVNNSVNTLLVKTGPGKLSAQMRMAFAFALERGYEGIITIDGNNKDTPAEASVFKQALLSGYDHIQGSRFIPGGKEINTPKTRLVAIKLVHAPLISLASGFHYTDTTNGFRAYSAKFLLDERVAPFRDIFESYELHYYLAIRAARLGFKVKEVPVTRRYPAHGKIPTKISPIRGNIRILATLLNAVLGKYNP